MQNFVIFNPDEWRGDCRSSGVARGDSEGLQDLHGKVPFAEMCSELEARLLDWYIQTSDVAPLDRDPRGMPERSVYWRSPFRQWPGATVMAAVRFAPRNKEFTHDGCRRRLHVDRYPGRTG